MKYLFSALTLLLVAYSLNSQILDSRTYDMGFSSLQPKTIIPAIDQGFIITGTISGKEFIMKIDSARNFEWGRRIFKHPRNPNYFGESVLQASDSSYFFSAPYNEDDSIHDVISLSEIDNFGGILQKKLVDLGMATLPISHMSSISGKSIIFSKGSQNSMLIIDSLGTPLSAKSWEMEAGWTIEDVQFTSDSTFVIAGGYESEKILFEINHEGDVLWSRKYEYAQQLMTSTSLKIHQDSMYLLSHDGYGSGVYCLVMDRYGEVHRDMHWSFFMDEFSYFNKVEFIKIDSSGYLFYAGKSIIASDIQGNKLKETGTHIAFRGSLLQDSSYYLLVKNGSTPVLSSDGQEFAVMYGVDIDNVFEQSDTWCIYEEMSYPYGMNTYLGSDSAQIIKMDIDFTIMDTVSLINNMTLDTKIRCPDAPNSIQEKEALEVNIYPNPAHFQISITSEEPWEMVEVRNAFGSLLYRQRNAVDVVQISTIDWPRGVYFLSVNSEGKQAVRKIIIQH